MLDANIQDQLRAYMERLAAPIELLASLDAGEKSGEMRALLAQVAASSAQITLLEGGGDARTPSFAIGRAGEGARIQLRRPADGPRVHLAGAGACCRRAAIRRGSTRR